MTLGVRAIIENQDGRVLLVRHTYTPGLYLPGGGVERGEPAHTALQRELVEEAGVALTGASELLGIYSNHRVFRNDHVLLYRLRSSEWSSCTATQIGEISETLWVDPQNPPEDITPGNKRRLDEIYKGVTLCNYW